MKLAPLDRQFLRPEANAFDESKSRFGLISAPLECTVSYGHGTARGPEAILEASSQIEFWDCELKKYPFPSGVATFDPLDFSNVAEENIKTISNAFQEVLESKKIPVMLGGEHTVTLGGLSGLIEYRRNNGLSEVLTILQFDAHGDLRFEYEGTPYSHACVMRQCLEKFPSVNLVQVGIRAISEEEEDFIETATKTGRLNTFFAHDRKNWQAKNILTSLKTEDVYITFDVDGFDPSFLPATGTPVPDGLFWGETMEILRLVAANKNIVAMDIVELAPRPGFEFCDFTTALLVYKMMAYGKGSEI